MGLRDGLPGNIMLTLAASAVTLIVLNPLSVRLGWFDGISLTALLIDDCFDAERAPYFLQAGRFLAHRGYWISRKDRHPNREGHQRMAEELLPKVREIVSATRPEAAAGAEGVAWR